MVDLVSLGYICTSVRVLLLCGLLINFTFTDSAAETMFHGSSRTKRVLKASKSSLENL